MVDVPPNLFFAFKTYFIHHPFEIYKFCFVSTYFGIPQLGHEYVEVFRLLIQGYAKF